MPVRVIGMIGVAPPGSEATVHIIKGGISPAYLKSYAQAHDEGRRVPPRGGRSPAHMSRERMRKRTPSGASTEKPLPRPATTSTVRWVCRQ